MKSVDEILRSKGREVSVVSPGTTVLDTIRLMAEKRIGAVVVVEAERVVGIFSERDYARRIILEGRCSKDTPVSAIMTHEVQCVSPATRTSECMALMTEKRIRHLPVVDGDRLVGIISIGDVVKSIIAEQAIEIGHLQDYIQGKYV